MEVVFTTDSKLNQCVTPESFNERYFVDNLFSETEELYCLYKSELLEVIENLKLKNNVATDLNSMNNVTTNESNIRLPKISIPMFSGNYTEWITFRELYISLIHENSSLDSVHKMHYLKGYLTGEAEQLLRHVPISAANYSESWRILNSRYNNKKHLSNCLLKRFMNQPSIVTESCKGIKELLDNMVETLNGLKNFDINVDSWDVIIIYIVTSKLDHESRKQWESKISGSDELPRFRSVEFLDTNKQRVKPGFSTKPRTMHAISNSCNAEEQRCIFCSKKDHKICNCKFFSKIETDARRVFVQTNGLCFNCLGRNHSANVCRVKSRCRICKSKHHSLLHPKSNSDSQTSHSVTGFEHEAQENISNVKTALLDAPSSSIIATHFTKGSVPHQILLATALVNVTGSGYTQVMRALLDQGSQALNQGSSFVTESAVQLLGLMKIPTRSTISGLGDGSSVASKYVVELIIKSRHDPSFSIQVRAHVLGTITSLLPSQKVSCNNWPQLAEIRLADPNFAVPNKIDILLGADVYGQTIREGLIKGPNGTPVAQNTALGWILSGPTHLYDGDHSNSKISLHNIIVSMHAHAGDNELLKQFWEIESEHPRKEKIFTEEEQLCEDIYRTTTQRNVTGRYIVRLPFRDADPQCKYSKSRDIALKRFRLLENRLKKCPEVKEKYSEVFHEYLDLGHMVKIQSGDDPKRSEAVYLPHHAVIREDKITTKVRIVFDASMEGVNGVSLNDTLMVGPKLQQGLRHIVMRWRLHPVCLNADIVKMYRQVEVAEQDTDFQRVVWRDDPDSEIEDYKLVRVTFGTACAPYLAVKTLQQVADDHKEKYPFAAERVKNDFYVDDLMTGCQSEEEGRRIYKEMIELLREGGFEVQKWITNNAELADDIMEGGKDETARIPIKVVEVVKVLGLSWDKRSDEFQYSVKFPPLQEPITKRKVISDISRLFDPLGWAAPCVITAKVMIQKLWLCGIDWDEELPLDLMGEWMSYREQLTELSEFRVSRWIGARDNDVCKELHGFCDASNIAYAAVVYLRTLKACGEVTVNLVAARTKVAPTRQVSIPRLELMGAVLLAKLLEEVSDVLNIKIEHVHGWTDSTVVLSWLSSHPSRWTTFIGNRTSEILSIMNNTQWAHVKSAHNPADIASRGLTASELSHSDMWICGPTWLREQDIKYTRPKAMDTTLEQRKIKSHVATEDFKDDTFFELLCAKYSALKKLVRVIAFCRRFLKQKDYKKTNRRFSTYLTSEELDEALDTCIKSCQCDCLDINDRRLRPLCPFLDDKGLQRVGGRIDHANVSLDVKHPILLPSKSHFTALIVDDAHKQTLHGGSNLMLNYLRSKYWIVGAKNVVKAYIRKCVVCTRHAAVSKSQFMGQLPSSRVTPARPFLHSGVDFAGPINLRISKGRGARSYKGYICLFICMCTRAVHLEAISDLTSQGFIAGFKRFVSRRGHCSDIWSDNGTNFVGAARELHNLVAAENSSVADEIRSWLNSNNTNWHFIPPHAPNFGGLWEAGVKSTKFHLRRVIGESTLTFEEMATVLAQVEACLNSRPLSIPSNDPSESLPLTPGHFLVGEPLITVPERNYEQCSLSSLRRWQVTQRIVQDFWRRWSNEYLVHCLQRYKWTKVIPEPNIGDVVLVKEDNLR